MGGAPYSPAFRSKMLEKLLGPNARRYTPIANGRVRSTAQGRLTSTSRVSRRQFVVNACGFWLGILLFFFLFLCPLV